jgi:hypothetical protein
MTAAITSLTAVYEFIQLLSDEDKIPEGDYLKMMNHLKGVYAQIPAAPTPLPAMGGAGGASPLPIVSGYFNRVITTVTSVSTPLRAYLEGPTAATAAALNAALLTSNGRILLAQINYVGWRDLEARERFLALSNVRRDAIESAEGRKQRIRIPAAKRWLAGGIMGTADDEARHLANIHFPFFTDRKVSHGKVKERAGLNKLHKLEVTFQFGKEYQKRWFYTEKIQLGRSAITGDLYRWMLTEAIIDGRQGYPMERFIRKQWSNEPPHILTSGITAKTREMSRTYVSDAFVDGVHSLKTDFTITYISKLNEGGKK